MAGMYGGHDYPYKSCLYTFGPPIPTLSFNFIVILILMIVVESDVLLLRITILGKVTTNTC